MSKAASVVTPGEQK